MKIRIHQVETLRRNVTYIADIPDDRDIKDLDSYDLDSITCRLTPQFGLETIDDLVTVSIEKV